MDKFGLVGAIIQWNSCHLTCTQITTLKQCSTLQSTRQQDSQYEQWAPCQKELCIMSQLLWWRSGIIKVFINITCKKQKKKTIKPQHTEHGNMSAFEYVTCSVQYRHTHNLQCSWHTCKRYCTSKDHGVSHVRKALHQTVSGTQCPKYSKPL